MGKKSGETKSEAADVNEDMWGENMPNPGLKNIELSK
jgi:hypothetical protein